MLTATHAPTLTMPLIRGVTIEVYHELGPGVTTDGVGEITYMDSHRRGYQRAFLMINDQGNYTGKLVDRLSEVKAVIAIGDRLEHHHKDIDFRYQVMDVTLPKGHHYSGTCFGYRRTKELFRT